MRSIRKLQILLFLIFFTLPLPAQAITVGTFNAEFFSIYAHRITNSGADVLAMQEVEGNATMRYFVLKFLPGWKYIGNDTKDVQDLYFLWNPKKVTLVSDPKIYFDDYFAQHNGKNFKVFDRPPFAAAFHDSKKTYMLINIHLKSNFIPQSAKNAEQAKRYNIAKRSTQLACLNNFADSLKIPALILGDFNTNNAVNETSFPVKTLKRGYTLDNWNLNLDYIGYVNIPDSAISEAREVESSLSSRSTRKKEHPDHDIIIVDVR